MNSDTIAFRTKVDLWLVGILTAALGASTWSIVTAIRTAPAEGWVALVILLATIALVISICVPTRYLVTKSDLVIRSGVIRSTIPLDSIERVYCTHNPLAAPAWSLDRLRVDYRRGAIRRSALISPAHQMDFLKLLEQRVPLELSGSELVRPSGPPI